MREPTASSAGEDEALDIADLKARLEEAEQTLEAIRAGEVDALVINNDEGAQVFTLESADRPYRLLIEQMQEGALTLGANGRILYCNKRFATFVDVESSRLIGAPLVNYVMPEDQILLTSLVHQASSHAVRGEVHLREGVSGRRPVMISIAHFHSEDGVTLCGIVSDLTEQNRRSQELVDTNQELRTQIIDRERAEAQLRQAQKMEAVGQLTGGVAHDFNNLLTVILGNLQLSLKGVTDTRAAQKIKAAIGAAERGARLNEQLLSFARRQTLRIDTIDINLLLPGLENLIRHAIGASIILDIRGTPGIWSCCTDRNQLESALLNLAINARDAMPEGGRLTISMANMELDAAKAAAMGEISAGRYVAITVTDTGTGIDPALLPRVMEPFFTTKPVGAGSGLGLSQAYGFVRQTGGTLKIDSTLGQGTSVSLILPWAEQVVEAVAGMPASSATSGHGKVLVVEDEEGVRALAVEILRDLGYNVIAAEKASVALERLAVERDVDLVFSDVVMPGSMNGIELAREVVRRNPSCGILLTSGFTAGTASQSAPASEFHFLPKPYEPNALSMAIAAAFESRNAAAR